MSTILASGSVCDSTLLHTAWLRTSGSVCDSRLSHTAWLRTCGSVCDSTLLHTVSLRLDKGRVLDAYVNTGGWDQQLKCGLKLIQGRFRLSSGPGSGGRPSASPLEASSAARAAVAEGEVCQLSLGYVLGGETHRLGHDSSRGKTVLARREALATGESPVL